MIAIKKDSKNAPKELLKCANKHKTELLKTKVANRDWGCYQKSKPELEKLYHKKCAYCETKYTEFTRIEHYRPISRYFWLAHEWSNLLPTCEKCNTAKGNKFPISNKYKFPINLTRLKTSLAELNKYENPEIINPELDNPDDFFFFNERTGEIIAKDDNERAKSTINICKLNRADCIEKRQALFNEILKNLKLINLIYLQDKEISNNAIKSILRSLYKKTKSENEYSAFQKQIWNNFKNSIMPHFKSQKLINFILSEYIAITEQQ